MKRKHLIFMLLALLGITTFSQGCSKDDDDGGTEVVNGGSNNNGDNNGTNNGGTASNDDKPTNGDGTNNGNNDGTNNGGETKTDPTELDWKVKWDYISDDFFPSWTYNFPECISISIPKESEGARIKLTVEGNKFMDQTVVEETVTADMIKKESYTPKNLNWKQDALVNAVTTGNFNVNAVLEINGKVIQRFNKRVYYHSINECVTAVTGTEKGDFDLSKLFTVYVNEDNPNIDKVLKQCLVLGENRVFQGNQGSLFDVYDQIWWVWQYFTMRGNTYSDISTTSSNTVESSDGTKLYSQYVRFFDQCYNLKQANCVDGSCMLASIYRKIGLDVALVLVPGHCFLAVCPKTSDVKGHEKENTIVLETTLMGNTQINGEKYDPNNEGDNLALFDCAVKRAYEEYNDVLNKYGNAGVNFFYIGDARADGLMPIQHIEEINVDVLDAPIVFDFTPSVDKVSFNKSEHKYIGYYSNENNAYDNTDYNYRYTIGFTLTYPNVESTKETGFIIGDALYFDSNGLVGQGCRKRWQNSQSTSSTTMYYYSNLTSATVFVQGYCIDKYGYERRSSKQQVNCVYSALGTK